MNRLIKKKMIPWDQRAGDPLIPATGIAAGGTLFDPLANVMSKRMTRRGFLTATALTGATVLLASAKSGLLDLPYAEAAAQAGTVRFALIADSHTMGAKNPRMKSRLSAAVNEVNALIPRPDWVIYMGDAVHDGSEDQFKYFEEIMAGLQVKKVYYVPGEHDWYLDMGNYYMKNMVKGRLPWSFDDKGVHFVGLNGILYPDFWTVRKLSPQERMNIAGTLNHPMLGPFTLGREQLDWLEKDLSRFGNDAPVVIFTHPPLYHYYRPWNFWTEDAPEAHEILKRFKSVHVLHGHVHQTVQNRIDNIQVIGHVSTAWPHPYPPAYHTLGLTGQMPRSDPSKLYDGLGWARYELGEREVKHEDIVWTLRPPKV
ncbi:MAG: metallophosphoesterase [Nitrospirae bacterium]|nr:metallophosphoesterase [Nitrospirota bacterium]